MFSLWALVSFRAARRTGRLWSGITTGLIVAFATFVVFDLLILVRVNVFLNELTGRADWIYCSAERCPRCPHGDFRFRYGRNKRKDTLSVKYMGTMAFSYEVIEGLRAGVRKPAAAYIMETKPDSNKSS
jgi:hypothetical protein